MLNEHDGDAECVADLNNILHQLAGFRRVHTRSRFVEQKQRRICGKCADNLQSALRTIWQRASLILGQVLHIKDTEQLSGSIACNALFPPVTGDAENCGSKVIFRFVVQADQNVIENCQITEEADILERAGDTELVDLSGGFIGGIDAVKQDRAARRLIDLGQKVENRCLSGTIRADEASNFRAADGHIEIADSGKTAEINAQVTRLQNRTLVNVSFGNDVSRRNRNELSCRLFIVTHALPPPFPDFAITFFSAADSFFRNRPTIQLIAFSSHLDKEKS